MSSAEQGVGRVSTDVTLVRSATRGAVAGPVIASTSSATVRGPMDRAPGVGSVAKRRGPLTIAGFSNNGERRLEAVWLTCGRRDAALSVSDHLDYVSDHDRYHALDTRTRRCPLHRSRLAYRRRRESPRRLPMPRSECSSSWTTGRVLARCGTAGGLRGAVDLDVRLHAAQTQTRRRASPTAAPSPLQEVRRLVRLRRELPVRRPYPPWTSTGCTCGGWGHMKMPRVYPRSCK